MPEKDDHDFSLSPLDPLLFMITDHDMDKTKFNNGINVHTCISCDSMVSFSFRLPPNFIPITAWSGKLTRT